MGGVPRKPDRPFRLLHASLIEVAATVDEFITSGLLQLTEQGPVVVVVFLDYLKSPAAVSTLRPNSSVSSRSAIFSCPASRNLCTASPSLQSAEPVSWWNE